ncbi:MAG: GDSL-type esterase/lipase family protein [Bacteroidia bacterium]
MILKRTLLFIIPILFLAFAQDTDKEKLPYVKYNKNVIYTPAGDSGNLSLFWPKFHNAVRNLDKLNIIHFGGSHIQVDIYPNLMREKLHMLDSINIASRGLVFPYSAAKTNNPTNYRTRYKGEWKGQRSSVSYHKSTWGVIGISAITSDNKPSFSMTFERGKTPVAFNKATVFCNSAEAGYNIKLPDSVGIYYVNYTADGYAEITYAKTQNAFVIDFEAMPEHKEMLVWGVLLENNNYGITYNSIGVNGSRFVSFKRCEKFDEQLKYLNPDLAIISIGTNDSSDPSFDSVNYEHNYDSFIQQVLKANPNCAFVLTVPNDNYIRRKYINEHLPEVQRIIFRLAKKYKTHVWDMFAIMGGLHSSKTWKDQGMMKTDLVHFTKDGYLLKGDLFYDAFMQEYYQRFPDQDE